MGSAEPGLFLLPAFDEYVVGYTDRAAALDARYASHVTKMGMLEATLVANGQIVGTWKRTLKKSGVAVLPAPFETLTEAQRRAFHGEAARYARFLGVSLLGW